MNDAVITGTAAIDRPQLPIREDLMTGIDVGGTKIHIADTVSTTIRRYDTQNYANMDAVLDDYFQSIGARPAKIAVGMAGPRDDETGEIKLNNASWPAFKPLDAAVRYGITFTTANDMVATMAGVLQDAGVNLLQLKPGTSAHTGTKMVVTLSTGIGTAAAVWDEQSKRYVILAGEGGHIGFQPNTAEEKRYLNYLHKKYPHASAELALSGKHGIDNLVDHKLETLAAPHLTDAIKRARKESRPVGAVLLAVATEGAGADQEAAQAILRTMGAMLGSTLRDLTLTYKATGGVYLTGSVSLALGGYLAEHTEMIHRFVHKGAVYDSMLENVSISLVADPNVAVAGAIALAKGL